MKDKILLFIPAYNCEIQIIRVLDQMSKKLLEYITEIIIVNNRSQDKTEQTVIDWMKKHDTIPAKLLTNKNNYGLGGSHKIAFNYALENQFDFVIVLHGDDQGNIKDLFTYIENGAYKKYDSFLGSRFDKKSNTINYSKVRILGNYIFNTIISIICRSKVTDLGSGLNMYKTKYLSKRFYLSFPNSLTFNVYMLLYGIYSKSSMCFFPLTWKEEDQISNVKFIKQSIEILRLLFLYVFRKKELFSIKNNSFALTKYEFELIKSNIT